MSSDPDTWGGLPDVKIDDEAASSLVSASKDAAKLMPGSEVGAATSSRPAAEKDFKGRFSTVVRRNQDTANEDAEPDR